MYLNNMSNVFYAENDNQPIGTFSVVEVGDTKQGDLIQADDENWVFEDDSSIGSIFFGIGVIRSLLDKGANLLVVLNPADKTDLK